MATHDYVLDNATGANFRSDLNNALAAIVSNNSSSSEPSTKYAYQWWADTNDGVLKIRNSSNDGWVTLLQLDGTLTLEDGSASAPALGFRDDLNTGIFSSAADTLDVTCGGTTRGSFSSSGLTVTGNVTATTFVGNIDAVDGDFDGTLEADAITVAGTALSTVIAGTTVTTATNANHVSVADNESTNENNLIPFIEDASATGNVGLESDGDFTYNPSTGTVTATKFVGETVLGDTSPQLGGNLDSNSNHILLNDSARLKCGAGEDLQIFHEGSNSYIQDSGTGSLYIKSSAQLYLQSYGGETFFKADANGAVELYYDNSKKFETRTNGITVTGYTYSDGVTIGNGTSEKYLAGDASQLQMYHTGSGGNGYLVNSTGTLHLGGGTVGLVNAASNAFLIKGIDGGAAELYHNGSKKLETTSSGVNVIGSLTVDGSAVTGGGGKILQVVSTTRTDTFSQSSVDENEHSGAAISVTITPSSTSSKIFLIATLTMGLSNDNEGSFAFYKGGVIISGAVGDAAGSRTRTGFGCFVNSTSTPTGLHGSFLDSPSTTSATTYDCRLSHGGNGGNLTVYLNRSHSDTNADQDSRYVSTITAMEVGA